MYMTSPSVIFEGDVYWDCQEIQFLDVPILVQDSSSSGYSSSETEELHQDLQDLAFEELGETPELRQTSIAELRAWMITQPHLSACCSERSMLRLDLQSPDSDNFLLRFLRFHKFNIPKSSAMLTKYLEMRCENPNWFMDLDPVENEHMRELVKSGYVFVLPERDAEGRRVIFNYAQVLNPSRHTSSDVMKTFISTFETLLAEPENQIRGFSYIFYCKGLTLTHCQIWSPSDAARMFSTCEKNLPLRHRSINLVHLPFGIWAVFEFAKSFLSSKIKNRISTLPDDKKMAAKIGKEILPKEFGGIVPLAEMTESWLKELCDNRARLEALDSLVILSVPDTPSAFKTPSSPTKRSFKF